MSALSLLWRLHPPQAAMFCLKRRKCVWCSFFFNVSMPVESNRVYVCLSRATVFMYARLQLVTPALAQVTRGGDRAANTAARASAPSKIANSSTSMRAATSAVLSVRSSSEVQGVEASDSRATRNQSSHPRSSFPDALTSVSPSDILRSRCVVIHLLCRVTAGFCFSCAFYPRLTAVFAAATGTCRPALHLHTMSLHRRLRQLTNAPNHPSLSQLC